MRDAGTRGRAAAIRYPVYVNHQGARVSLAGRTLEVAMKDQRLGSRLRLDEMSEMIVMGNIQVTTPALQELMRRGIPVCWTTTSGWFLGATSGFGHGDGALRAAQHAAAADPLRRIAFARIYVTAKIRNCRTLLRRNGRGREAKLAVRRLTELVESAERTGNMDRLRGYEGAAAAIYFKTFPAMLRERAAWAAERYRGRSRRPPRDPVNSALSFAYTVQTRSWSVAVSSSGLDLFTGFLHGFRHGRPALALDMMEPARPRIADSVVLRILNSGMLKAGHMEQEGDAVLLGDRGRRVLLGALEDRLDNTSLHDVLGGSVAYRDLPFIESARLARALRRDEEPPAQMRWR